MRLFFFFFRRIFRIEHREGGFSDAVTEGQTDERRQLVDAVSAGFMHVALHQRPWSGSGSGICRSSTLGPTMSTFNE